MKTGTLHIKAHTLHPCAHTHIQGPCPRGQHSSLAPAAGASGDVSVTQGWGPPWVGDGPSLQPDVGAEDSPGRAAGGVRGDSGNPSTCPIRSHRPQMPAWAPADVHLGPAPSGPFYRADPDLSSLTRRPTGPDTLRCAPCRLPRDAQPEGQWVEWDSSGQSPQPH